MILVPVILIITGIYLAAGFIFAIFFVIKGLAKVDAGAEEAGLGFRLIIIPGSILLWPYLWKKWINSALAKKMQG